MTEQRGNNMQLQDIADRLQRVNQSEVARLAGVTRSYVNAIANGVRLNPTMRTIKKIHDALKVVEGKNEDN